MYVLNENKMILDSSSTTFIDTNKNKDDLSLSLSSLKTTAKNFSTKIISKQINNTNNNVHHSPPLKQQRKKLSTIFNLDKENSIFSQKNNQQTKFDVDDRRCDNNFMMDKSSSSSSTTTTTASNSSATSSDGEEMAASGTVKKNSSSQELKTSSSPSSHSQKQQQSSGMDSSKVANDQQQQQSAKHQKNSNDSNLADLIKRLKSQITQLQDLVTQKDKKIIDLNEKLDQQSDYDEIKRELSMVRSELSHFGSMVPLDPITSITTVDDDDDNNNNNNTDNNIVNNNIDDNNNDDHNDADDDDDVERSISPSAILSTEFNTISNHDDNQHQSINFPYHPPHPSMISASPATTAAVNTATTTASSSPSIFNSFNFPPLHNLGNVDAFGSLIGEEIANTYAKAMAAAAAAAASSSSSNNSLSNNNNKLNHSSSHHQHQPISNQKNSNNNDTQPSQLLNGDMMANVGNNNPNNETSLEIENNNKQLMESASTTPTASAMICSMVDGAEPLTHSPLGATTVNDLGLNTNNYSHIFYDKLQHHLRCNVEKYMNETLNTLQISRYVRELLSVHNIGQRLFAKYVLGLSQGTVSELLSKPKPWDKLTEKGRDSYRKMHAWSTDDRCINLLKMMVPRKEYGSYIGKDSNSYGKQDETSGGAGSNNVGAEERISQILSEARRSMKNVSTLNRQELLAHSFLNGENLAAASMAKSLADIKEMKNLTNDTISDNGSDRDENKSETLSLCDRKSPSSTASSSLITNPTAMATISNFYKNINDPLQNERLNNNRTPVRNLLSSTTKPNDAPNNDEIASAELIRLYQAMMTQQLEEGFRNSQNYDDIRNVIAIHQELSRLNSFQQTNPELIARLFSSSLMNGPNYLNGLPLHLDGTLQPSGGQQLIDNSANIRKVDSPQQQQQRLESNRDSPNIKLDNLLLNQIKSDPLSPSHNGNNLSTNCQQLPSTNQSTTFNNPNADSPDDSAASPLQRMQSITNSLLSQSSLPTLPSQPPRPAKAVLPPITQQQFDQYNNLNTEDIVKRVKEQLSQYSISQRLFGESVLGLSQGSVSDLLARPKPWHMLTQKGREPFIRMKMFLEDDNAIHKLVASQYKIAPEKLMRTGNFVGGTGIAPTALPVINPAAVIPPPPPQPSSQPQLPGSPQALPPHLNALASAAVAAAATNISSVKNSSNPVKGPNPVELAALKYEQSLSPSSIDNSVRSNTSSPDLVSFNRDASSPTAAAAASSSPSLSARSRLSAYNNINNNLLRPILNQQTAAPSVYELAALTSDLDTQIITTRIKETLMAHNIGQKIFGEVVLGLSQGSVSELLSKPKPWHMLSIKGREPFIRMQLWLNDTHNIDKLQTLKNERREANKRRRTHLDESLPNFKPFDNQLLNQFPNFGQLNSLGKNMVASPGSNVTSGYAGITSMQTGGQPVVKKARILFTEQQKEALRVAFSMDPYPSSATAEFLAKELNLSVRTITNWFHNHRMRLKQINSSASSSNQDQDSSNPPTTGAGGYNMGRDNVLFDQDKFRQLLEHRLADLKHRNESTNNSNNNNNISHGNNLNDSNSNQFGSSSTLYSTSQQNSPPSSNNHRMKYSPSSMFQAQSIYSNNTNSCSSPASSSSFHEEEEDLGTLDLSISSHAVNSNQFCTNRSSPDKLDSTGRSSMHDDSDDNCRDTGDDDDDDVQNAGNNNTNNNDNDQQRSKQSTRHQQNNRSGSSRRKPTNVISSSSRRKAAQPQQWVAPIDPSTLLNDDDYIDDDSPFIADSKTTDNNEDFDNHKTGDKSSNSNANNILSYDDDNQDDEDGYEIDYKSKLDDEDLDLDDDDDDGGEMIKKRPVNNSDDDDDIDHINHLPFKRHKSSNSQSPPSSSSDAATTIHRKIHQECVQ